MLLAAEFGVGQVLWSLFWFYLFAMWIMVVFFVFADIFRNDLPGSAKALWAVVIIFVPYLGVFGYIVAHGQSMGRRAQRGLN